MCLTYLTHLFGAASPCSFKGYQFHNFHGLICWVLHSPKRTSKPWTWKAVWRAHVFHGWKMFKVWGGPVPCNIRGVLGCIEIQLLHFDSKLSSREDPKLCTSTTHPEHAERRSWTAGHWQVEMAGLVDMLFMEHVPVWRHKSSRKNSQPLSWVERLQTLQKCTWCRYFVLPTKTATWTFTSSKFTSATAKVFHPITLGILDFYVFLTMLVSAKSLPMGSPALLWIPPNRWRDSKFKGV